MEFQMINLLLDLIHKASTAGPKYSWIVTMADKVMDELRVRMQDELAKVEATPEAAPDPTPTTERRL